MDNKLSDLTIIIVTFRTNISILKDCLKSIDPSIKVLIVGAGRIAGLNELDKFLHYQ